MDSLRLKIPPFEKARTVLEALKEQESRKKVGSTWCFHSLRKGQVSREIPGICLSVALQDMVAAPWELGLRWVPSSGCSNLLVWACSSPGLGASFSSSLVPRSDGAEHNHEALTELTQPLSSVVCTPRG